ncbi:MAG: divergent polysaccharide deacetylase family protein [Syntrophobacteraceae bacterium]|nr:divergent polysaccharide deacetylase family protein [Syntrophobacteraceae bacterium]
MPSAKRTKTGKSSGGKKGKGAPKASPAIRKRPSRPLLIAWVLALSFLASLLYFARPNRILSPVRHPFKVAKSPAVRTSPPEVRTNRPGPQGKQPATVVPAGRTSPHSTSVPGAPPPPVRRPLQVAKTPAVRTSPPEVRTNRPGPPDKQPATVVPAGLTSSHSASVPGAPAPKPPALPVSSPRHARPKLAIVIDDLGPNITIARQFASLPFPVTLSVLPFQAYSSQIAKMAHLKGREVILHLPMQPLNSRINPGPGAVMVSMSPEQIRLSVNAALDISPFFDGANNHEGSRLTQDARAMGIVLSVLKSRRLFFIDSMTINKSVGWKEARRMSVPTCKRNVFLDDTVSAAAIGSQIARAVAMAKTRGAALAIGHPREVTLQALRAAAAYFSKEGVEMVSARDLVRKN